MRDIGFYGAKLSCRICGIPCQDVGMKDQLSPDEAADLVDNNRASTFAPNFRSGKQLASWIRRVLGRTLQSPTESGPSSAAIWLSSRLKKVASQLTVARSN